MKLAAYKTSTLARADVDDIVMIEPVENRPVKDETGKVTGYEQVVHTTELGKTLRKYDIHLMRVVDGVKQFVKEHIVVVDQGLATEEVVFTAPTTEPKETTLTQIETYINSLPYENKKILEIDTAAPSATFTGLKIVNGVATRVEVYAYRKGTAAPTYVEITK